MSVLMRASEIEKRPVVTLAGEDIAQIKDIIYAANGGEVGGFTLNGRGRLSGPLKTALEWKDILALGPDAVMVTDESALSDRQEVLDGTGASDKSHGGNVLGSQVLTDDGVDLGKVVDVILEVVDKRSTFADVVGYEIDPAGGLGKDVKKALIPLPDTIAASGEHLIVPASAQGFIGHDLAGFGAAVIEFRKQLGASK